jgi:hypothetical protein
MAQTESNVVGKLVSRLFTVPAIADGAGRARRIICGWLNRHRDRAMQVRSRATRRLDVPEPAAASFSGPIADIPISELVQTIAMSRKDGVITVRHEARESQIWFLGGEIVDAECGRLTGELAFYRIATLERGHVSGDFRPVPRLRTIHGSAQALLLEAARRKDQCELLSKRIGDTLSVYSPTAKALSEARQGRSALAVLRAFYPAATLEGVLSQLHLGDLEAMRIVVALIEDGWLAPNRELTAERLTQRAAEALPGRAIPAMLTPHFAVEGADRARSSSKGTVLLGSAFAIAFAVVGLAKAWAPASDATRSPAPSEGLPTPSARGSSSAAPPEHVATLAAEEAAASAAEVRVVVEVAPRDATLSLDGGPAATGPLALRFARDGRTHELRVAAPGYETARVLFSDERPPALIELVATADSLPAAPEPSATAHRRLPALRRPATPVKSAPTPATSNVLENEPTARSSEIEREWPVHNARMPRVKIIPNEDPTVVTLE